MLVLPAAAAPVGQGTNVNANAIDQGLKDDLWNNHVTERMQEFNLHVQHATDVIAILNKYGIDTTQMQNTLNSISAKGTELQTALNNKDKDALKTINNDLKELWKQYLQEMRDSIKDHYGKLKAANKPEHNGKHKSIKYRQHNRYPRHHPTRWLSNLSGVNSFAGYQQRVIPL